MTAVKSDESSRSRAGKNEFLVFCAAGVLCYNHHWRVIALCQNFKSFCLSEVLSYARTLIPCRLHGGPARRGPQRRRRGLPGLRELQCPPGRQEFYIGRAARGRQILPRPGRAGPSDPQHPGHRPGAAQGGGAHPYRRHVRCGRLHRPGSGRRQPLPPDRAPHPPARLYANVHPQPGGRPAGRRHGPEPGGAGPGAGPQADRLHLPELPHRDRGLCPRGAVHVLFRPVLYVRRHRPAQRQPGPVRPALPPALRLQPL